MMQVLQYNPKVYDALGEINKIELNDAQLQALGEIVVK